MSDEQHAKFESPEFSNTLLPEQVLRILINEIHSPLNSIRGCTNALREYEYDPKSEVYFNVLNTMNNSAERIQILTQAAFTYLNERKDLNI